MSADSLLSALDLSLFQALNGLIGRSWLFDSVVSAMLDNPVVKAGPVGACFFYAWYAQGGKMADPARRRILTITLISLFIIAPVSKLLSEAHYSPRPFVETEATFVWDGETVEAIQQIDVRLVQTGAMAGRIEGIRTGHVDSSDLNGFPSDHAALYFALALGILLACRAAGIAAMAWVLGVIFLPRIAVGLHWTSDMVAGALLGASILGALQFVGARIGRSRSDAAMAWAGRRPALVSAIIFLLVIELVNTMPTLERGREIAQIVLQRVA